MGNQIVCPVGQNWFLNDLASMGLTVEKSLFDGTFLISYLVEDSKFHQQKVLKGFQIPEEDSEGTARTDAINVIQTTKSILAVMRKVSRFKLRGNIVSDDVVFKGGAYLIRPYFPLTLQSRMNDFPNLLDEEIDWISLQIIMSVNELQNNGMSHGDIKPENIVLTNRLQVLLVDHAIHKPGLLQQKQPNYFLHYFSYSGEYSYIAPERIIDGLPDTSVNLIIADLFSLGCLLAFIYLGGNHLFPSFTSAIAYKNGDKKPLEKLKLIKNEQMRDYILDLLSLNPNNRVRAFPKYKNLFPQYTYNLYDYFSANELENCYMNKTVEMHDGVMKILPEGCGRGAILYFNILQDVILSGGLATAMQVLSKYYVEMTVKHFDDRMKLTRALPPLFVVLEGGRTIENICIFSSICEIFKSIKEIPEEFEKYHTAYIFPMLTRAMTTDWSIIFLSGLPKWALSMKRLFPTFCHDLAKEISLFRPLFKTSTTSSKDPVRVAATIGFIRSCTQLANCGDIDLMYTLAFFSLPLVRSELLVTDVLQLFDSFFAALDGFGRRMFNDELIDPLISALLTNQFLEGSCHAIAIIPKLISHGMVLKPQYVAELTQCMMRAAENGGEAEVIASWNVVQLLPERYRIIFLSRFLPEMLSDRKPQPRSMPQSRGRVPARPSNEAPTMAQSNPIGSHSSDAKKVSKIRALTLGMFSSKPTSTVRSQQKSALIAASRLDGMINAIKFLDQRHVVVQHGNRCFTEIALGQNGAALTLAKTRKLKRTINTMSPLSAQTFVTADSEKVIVFATGEGHRGEYKIPNIWEISQLSTSEIATAVFGAHSIELRDSETFKVKSIFPIPESPLKLMRTFYGTPFIIAADPNNRILMFDTRIGLPVMQAVVDGLSAIVPMPGTPNLCFGVRTPAGFSVFDPSASCIVVEAIGCAECAIASEHELFLANRNGTFSIDPQTTENCFSYFEARAPIQLETRTGGLLTTVELPEYQNLSLHGHTFPVTSGDYRSEKFLTGDSDGNIRLWSPRLGKILQK